MGADHHVRPFFIDRVFSSLNISSLVRIPEKDYPHEFTEGAIVNHFNLPDPLATGIDEVVAMPKIVRGGYFIKQTGDEQLPILSLENVWKAILVDNIPLIECKSIPKYYLENTIGNVDTIEKLISLLLQRYSLSLPNYTENEILSAIEHGVWVRSFKLLEKISYIE